MSSDRTPADVIAGAFSVGRGVTNSPEALAHRVLDALTAAGFRVTPEPDDTTRALAARLRKDAKDNEDVAVDMGKLAAPWLRLATDLRAAAALLDGQPQDRPDRCPTCGSDDVAVQRVRGPGQRHCPDPWHGGGSGDTR